MSEQEYIYTHSPLTLAAEARLIADILGLALHGDVLDSPEINEIALSGSPRVSDARGVSVWVEKNDRAIPGEPVNTGTAADDYPYEIYVRVFGSEEAQANETRWMFDELIKSRPDTPMLLTHEGINLIAAYLPGRGSHDFPPGTDVDYADEAIWRAWVPARTSAPNTE